MAAQIKFAKLHLSKPKLLELLWKAETKVDMFGLNAMFFRFHCLDFTDCKMFSNISGLLHMF